MRIFWGGGFGSFSCFVVLVEALILFLCFCFSVSWFWGALFWGRRGKGKGREGKGGEGEGEVVVVGMTVGDGEDGARRGGEFGGRGGK